MAEDSARQSGAGSGEAEPSTPGGTEVRTVLIADIRGYTTYTEERGDEAAARLTERFAEITAEVVAERGGHLVELRGDEALVVFASTRQALRAALELQTQYVAAELPRGVGIGIDAGEAVAVGDGYRGSALNLAARLCALAGPGQVIASDAVTHLASTVEGIRYAAPRTVRVKGFADPIRTVMVEPAGDGAQPRRRPGPAVSGRRAALLAAGLVGAAVGTTAIVLLGMNQPDGAPSSSPAASGSIAGVAGASPPFDGPGLAFIDPESGEPIGERLTLGDTAEVRHVDGAFWTLAFDPTALHRVDPTTRERTISIPIGFDPGSWLVDRTTIWITDYQEPVIHEIDATSGRAIDDLHLADVPGGLGDIALGSNSLWVTVQSIEGGLLRVDPATGDVLHRYPIAASSVVASDDVVWANDHRTRTVRRIDPRTDAITNDVPLFPISDLLLAEGFLWAMNAEDGELYRINDQGRLTETSSVPGAWLLSAGEGHVWAAGNEERQVYRINSVTGARSELETGRSVSDVAEANGLLALAMPRQAADVLANVTGEVVAIGTQFDPFAVTDPAISGAFGNHLRDRLEQATCAKLLNYADVPAPDGWELTPEVAAQLPDVSSDGLTYTFSVRGGFAFSPPSNEPITAETFRFSIERALSPDLGPNAVGIEWLSAIEGASAFHEGRASSVTGLAASGSMLTITLERPDPMFLHKLAMPHFCPVPLETATILNGVSIPPIPRSGPFYFRDLVAGTVYHLERNPNYPGPRDPTFDGIVWRVTEDPGDLIAQVEAGELDVVTSSEGLEPTGRIAAEWGPGSAAAEAGDQRFFSAFGMAVEAVALNPSDPLLADATVRVAVGLALSLPALVEPWSGVPATSLVSPALPANLLATEVGPAPDVERALQLMAGRTGAVRIGICPFPPCEQWARALAGQLAEIGITAEVVTVELAEDLGDPTLEIGITNVIADCPCSIPDSAEPLARLLEFSPAGWYADELIADVDGIYALAEPQRSARAAQVADQLATDGLLFPMAWYAMPDYYSGRIGCQVPGNGSPGINLVALCLKDGG